MKNEKKYLKPEFELIEFNKEDIILTSNVGNVNDENLPYDD